MSTSNAISGAGAGAAYGSAFGPYGTAIGAVAGGLLGAFSGNSKAPTLADVNLARDNPELYKELENLQALIGEYDRQYQQRRQGASQGELAANARSSASYNEKIGNLGLTGSTAGANLMGAHDAQLQNALQERILQERQALLSQLYNARLGYMNAYGQAQQGALAGLQGVEQAHQQDEQSRNQFISGGVNSAINAYGSRQYADQQDAYRREHPIGNSPYLFPEDYR